MVDTASRADGVVSQGVDPIGSLADRLRELARDVGRRSRVMPSEPALAKQLGVSRPALREELARLESEGMLRRRHGAGTIVNVGALDLVARFDQQAEFVDVIRNAGFRPGVELIDRVVGRADAAVAASLGIDDGAPVVRTTKRWRADDHLVMLAIDTIPTMPSRAASLDGADPDLGLFELVHHLRGETVEWELAYPGAMQAPAPVQRLLDVPARTALLTLDLVGISRDGNRSYHAVEYHVPGVIRSGFVRSVRS